MHAHVAPIITRSIAKTNTEVKFAKADRHVLVSPNVKFHRRAAARAERHAVKNILRGNDWYLEDVL